jgi:hypothetical protein
MVGIVFLCGALRSGTSLLHLMLNSHTKVTNPGEFDFFFDYVKSISQEPDIQEYIAYLEKNRIFKSKNLHIDKQCKTYAELVNSFISQLSESKIVCLNIHRNFDIAYHYFPKSIFIHILRDPRDVAKSSIPMGWVGNTYYGVDHWLDTEYSWDRLASQASKEQRFEFKYEQLISDSYSVLSSLCKSMGLDYENEMLNYHERSTYSPPDVSLIEQWKRKQNVREIELVEYKACSLMISRGYELSRSNLVAPGKVESLKLWVSNKWYKYEFSIRRYGLFLMLVDKLIKAYPRFPRAEIYRARIHQIQKKHLK